MAATPHVIWRNTLTVVGSVLAALTILFILSFLAIDLAAAHPSPYIGLFTFLVFPTILVVAVGMMVLGLVLARRKFRIRFGTTEGILYFPRVDFTDAKHRRALGAGAAVLAAAVPVIGVMSYEGYHYTDSNEFCGKVCHEVMEPQFAAFQQSPHAHVACAECHIGPGASWYVKSKLSGIRQVFAVALETFPRPIPPAIQELRPATETCQQCHWPSKFFGDQLVSIEHYGSDEYNTHTRTRMLLKTGGSDPTTGPPSGIHWHMALGFTVEYVATDDRLQEIPWVQTTDHATKQSRVYRSDGLPGSAPPPEGTRRTVDCMDCHNRPTHIFRSPEKAADSALHVHESLQKLPFAKRELVKALAAPYAEKEEGLTTIASTIKNFYRQSYPDLFAARGADIDRLVEVAQGIYRSTVFPRMNVNWRTYPDNIGHKIFPGCFRCHEGKHVSDDGKMLSHDCGSCHEFLMPGPKETGASVVQVGGFVHPIPLEGPHAMLRCNECHTGGGGPDRTCAGCHTDVTNFRGGALPGWSGPALPRDAMADAVDCEACHDLTRPNQHALIDEKCMECHSDEEEKYKGMLAGWVTEVEAKLSAAGKLPTADRKLLDALRKAGPMHNIEAARRVLETISQPPKEANVN